MSEEETNDLLKSAYLSALCIVRGVSMLAGGKPAAASQAFAAGKGLLVGLHAARHRHHLAQWQRALAPRLRSSDTTSRLSKPPATRWNRTAKLTTTGVGRR